MMQRHGGTAHAVYTAIATLVLLGPMPRQKLGSHIDASLSRQPLVKGERLVRNEVNAVMIYTNSPFMGAHCFHACIASFACQRCK